MTGSRQRKAFLLFTAALCAGCGSIALPRPTRVYATTPVTDDKGQAIALGTGGDLMVALDAGTPSTGLPLRAGDVLYVRRWSAGNRGNFNPASPSHFIDRITLRHISPGGRLTDGEETFLLNLLVTNRQDRFSEFENLAQAIRKQQSAMWNGVVCSLRVKRIGNAPNNSPPFRLVATVDLKEVLGDNFPDADYFGSIREIAIDGVEKPASSAHEGLTKTQGTRKNENYYLTDPDSESRLFSFVSVALDGFDIRDPSPEETQWTLRELQESRVCRVEEGGHSEPLLIAAINVPSSRHRFWFGKGQSTHEVRRVLTANERSRRIVSLRKYTPLARYVLPDAALDELTVGDVSRIVWRTSAGVISGPAHCQPRGALR